MHFGFLILTFNIIYDMVVTVTFLQFHLWISFLLVELVPVVTATHVISQAIHIYQILTEDKLPCQVLAGGGHRE